MIGQLFSALSLIGISLMAGSVLYTSLVEIPVRQKTSAAEQLRNWHLVFPVASGLLKPFGIALTPLVLLAGIMTSQWLWYVALVLLIALVPITAKFIAPTNARLLAMQENTPADEITQTIQAWDRLHHLRTIMTLGAFFFAVLAVY